MPLPAGARLGPYEVVALAEAVGWARSTAVFFPDGKPRRVTARGRLPITIHSVDAATGQRSVPEEIADAPGSEDLGVLGLMMSPDGRRQAYTRNRVDSTLYLVDGVR